MGQFIAVCETASTMGEWVKGAERLPEGWSHDKDEKYAHGILIKSPEGQSFYSRRAVIEYMIKNKFDHIPTYMVWNTLHREGWHLGGPLIPWGWRFMNHKSGNERKYLTGEMIVFINSSDALKYIISNDNYDDKDVENFKKWIEENKFKVKTNLIEAPIKLPPNAIIVEPEAEKKKKNESNKTKEANKKAKKSPVETNEILPVKKSSNLADQIKSEFAKNFTPVKKPRAKKQSETAEKKKKRGKSTGKDLDLEDLLPPGWKFKRNKTDDDFTFTTSARQSLVGSDDVIEFMSSSKSFSAQDIENFIQWREMINEIKV